MDNKIIEENWDKKLAEFLQPTDAKELGKQFLAFYFGKGWTDLIYDVLTDTEQSEFGQKINDIYGEEEFTDKIIPNKKEDIFKYFTYVNLEDVKYIINTKYPGDIESSMSEKEIINLTKQGVFILSDVLTTDSNTEHSSLHNNWKPLTTLVKGYFKDKVPIIDFESSEGIVKDLTDCGITWEKE